MEATLDGEQQQPRVNGPPSGPFTFLDGSDAHGQLYSLFASGFNAHGQLDCNSEEDLRTFRDISQGSLSDVIFTCWSTTVLRSQSRVWSQGHQNIVNGDTLEASRLDSQSGSVENERSPYQAFGDHDGLLGLLPRHDGNLYIAEDLSPDREASCHLTSLTNPSSPSISHIALAGNDRLTVTFTQAPNGRLCHVVEFENLDKFIAWYRDPSGEGNYPEKHHMLPGRPKQLIANIATFLLLMEDGNVYSWGDPRQQSLGRAITDSEDTAVIPADEPGAVEALGGLMVVKVASGGWLSAALSEDGTLYLWGAMMPGSEENIACLREAGAGEVALVAIPGGESEPLDVIDVDVGDNHVAVVTADHRLWVVGDNGNGQLGLDAEADFFPDWTGVETLAGVQRVVCGPKCTFAFAMPIG